MTARVNARKGSDIHESVLKIQGECLLLRARLQKIRVIGIRAAAEVVGTYDKVKIGMRSKIGNQKIAEVGLKSDLNTETQFDPIPVFVS